MRIKPLANKKLKFIYLFIIIIISGSEKAKLRPSGPVVAPSLRSGATTQGDRVTKLLRPL